MVHGVYWEYGTPYLTDCYGGIDTIDYCHEHAVWTQYVDGERGALCCEKCKIERDKEEYDYYYLPRLSRYW